jgi:hypothetical protein
MKINDNAVTTPGTGDAFAIAATGRAFKILSDGLYSDKIRAVVRELSCNARDSHVAAGNTEPWEMHLPTAYEPWFSITDHGTGLSDADISSVYTRYFVSTKTTSNEFVGQLGLGSKSPFCYTDEFVVISRHGGVENQYRMYFDASDTPRVERLGTAPAVGTGVTVKFDTRGDHARWKAKAHQVLQWFDKSPIQTGELLTFNRVNPMWSGTGWRVWEKKQWEGDEAQALMGGVLYPVRYDNISNIPGELIYLLGLPIIINFDIGDLDVAASREGLSYDARTCVNIIDRLNTVADQMKNYVWHAIESKSTLWDARIAYAELFGGVHGTLLNAMYATEPAPVCKGMEIKRATINLSADDVLSANAQGIGFMAKGKKSIAYKSQCVVTAEKDVRVVYNDLKRGAAARIKQFHSIGKEHLTIVLPFESNQSVLSDLLGNPPIVLASELLAVPTKVRAKPVQLWEFVQYESGKRAWKPVDTAITALPDIKYYVILSMWDAYVDGKQCSLHRLSELLDTARSSGVFKRDVKIYGIRQAQFNKLEYKSTWVSVKTPIEAKAREMLADPAIAQNLIDSAESAALSLFVNKQKGLLRNLGDGHALNQIKYKLRDQNNDLVKFYGGFKELRSPDTATTTKAMSAFCSWLNIEIPTYKFSPDLLMLGEHVMLKYKMLRHVDYYGSNIPSDTVDDIVTYVDTVDISYAFLILTKEEPELVA